MARVFKAIPNIIEEDKKCILCKENITLEDDILTVNSTDDYVHAICYCDSDRGSLFQEVTRFLGEEGKDETDKVGE